jgi:hypothetical protein
MREKEKIYSEFLAVSKQTGVPVKKVLDVFWHLSRGRRTIGNNELVQRVGVSRNALNQVKKALSVYLSPSGNETSLRDGEFERVGMLYNSNYLVEESLLATLTKSDVYHQSVELLSRYRYIRPAPNRNYDQFTATVETTAQRTALLNFLGDLRGKRLLFLSDDDFTSTTTSNTRSAQEVRVLDIDERILEGIRHISQDLNLGIETISHDLRKPIPTKLRGKFDTVFTDPPYTPEGIRLFVSRAVEALDRENQTARIYICYGNSDRAKERFLPVQNIITDFGLMIRYVFDKFNRYERAESIGSASSLYVLETTPRTRSLVKGNYDKPIYTID